MLSIISFVLLLIGLFILAIEDFKTLFVDLRICLLLLLLSIFYAYGHDISLINYVVNTISGLFFMTFLYVFSLKIEKKYISASSIELEIQQIDNKEPLILGFIPSFFAGYLVYCIGLDNLSFIKDFTDNSKIFLSELYLYILMFILSFIVIKVIYILFTKKKYRQRLSIIQGIGDGDVIIVTIMSSVVEISDILVIMFVSLIIHLLSYIFIFIFNRRKYDVRV